MSAPPHRVEDNARRLMTAAALLLLGIAGSAIAGWIGGPPILMGPSRADATLSPAAACAIAACAAGLFAWSRGRLRAAALIGGAVATVGLVALVDAGLAALAGADAKLAIPPVAASGFALAGGASYFGSRHAVRFPEGRPGIRVVAGVAAIVIHAVGAAALLHRLFIGPSETILPSPYGAVAFIALGAGMGAVLWDAENRVPQLAAWRGAIVAGVALLWATGVWSFALFRHESVRWHRERGHATRTAAELFEARIVDRAWALHRLGERTVRGGSRFDQDAELLLRDLPSIRLLTWVDAAANQATQAVRRTPGAAAAPRVDAAAELARSRALPESGLLLPIDPRRPEAGLTTSVPVRNGDGLAGVVVAVSDTQTLFDHQLGSGLGDQAVAFVSYRGSALYRSDPQYRDPPDAAASIALPVIGDAWTLHLWWPSEPGPSVLPATLLAGTGLALSFLAALVVHLLGLARDRAAALEQRSRELEGSNRDLNDFAHAASHDLKAPLRAIENLAVWIAEDAAEHLPDESRKHLEQLRGRVKRLAHLLDDMLQYARAGQLRAAPESVATGELVGGIVELLAPRSTLAVTVAPGMPTVYSARAPLEQVFRNLISNAIKHHDRLEGRVTVAYRDLGAQVEFAVSDDGPGIDSRHRERVFQMFQTLRPRDAVEGSGIGLALVRRLVEAYGGDVVLESQGRGATFRFRWPKGSPA
jgi:signal transduction histidine kinase